MFCDLVQCYKIVYKQVDLPVDNLFSFDINSHNIRGHSLRLKRAGSLSESCCRYKFFSRNELQMCGTLCLQMFVKLET